MSDLTPEEEAAFWGEVPEEATWGEDEEAGLSPHQELVARVAALEDTMTRLLSALTPEPVRDMSRITPKAEKNLARGATFGAGTPVCQKCKGPKEPSRINSYKCKSCDSTPRDTSRKGPKE
jgi:hypothetical protein